MDLIKFAKKVTGIQAVQDRKEARTTKENAKIKYDSAMENTEELKSNLNDAINEFGKIRLTSIGHTIKPFMLYLKDLSQKCKVSEFEFIDAIDVKQEQFKEFEQLEMSASQILSGTLAASALGSVALAGVPTVITSAVTALATASTGTAISSLSGVAASNAVMAWLGGGTIAAGGGGMAAGAALLTAATWTATGGLALIAAGSIASAHYSKILTESKEYEKNVDLAVGEMQKAWIVMKGIKSRVDELKDITESLKERTKAELKYLAPLAPDYDLNDKYQLNVFQRCGLLVKSIAEISKTPIFNDDGDISEESGIIARKYKTTFN